MRSFDFLHAFRFDSTALSRPPGWGQLQAGFAHAYRFLRLLFLRLIEDRCLQTASALAYTTLLSLVPLMATIFNMFSAFPVFKTVEADIQNFIFSNFVPASGEVIQAYLRTFAEQTSKLTIVGIAFLIAAAVLMLETIDNALNSIWRTKKQRGAVRSFMVYWAILTLGPLLVGTGVFVTSYVLSMPWFSGMEQTAWRRFLFWLPFFTTGIAFTLLYLLIPNRNVPWKPALAGGVLAAVLFEVAKKGFALYVIHSDTYQTIYGALATIPIFLAWIYVSWVVILLGAETAYCLTTFHADEECSGMHKSDSGFMRAYRLLGHLWRAQCEGRALSGEALLALEKWRDEIALHKILEKLEAGQWVYRGDNEQWLLSRDLGEATLLDLYRLMSGGLLSSRPNREDAWSLNLRPFLGELNKRTVEIMAVPLKQLYQGDGLPDKMP